jgi:hypothetical protein
MIDTALSIIKNQILIKINFVKYIKLTSENVQKF